MHIHPAVLVLVSSAVASVVQSRNSQEFTPQGTDSNTSLPQLELRHDDSDEKAASSSFTTTTVTETIAQTNPSAGDRTAGPGEGQGSGHQPQSEPGNGQYPPTQSQTPVAGQANPQSGWPNSPEATGSCQWGQTEDEKDYGDSTEDGDDDTGEGSQSSLTHSGSEEFDNHDTSHTADSSHSHHFRRSFSGTAASSSGAYHHNHTGPCASIPPQSNPTFFPQPPGNMPHPYHDGGPNPSTTSASAAATTTATSAGGACTIVRPALILVAVGGLLAQGI